MLPDFAEIDEFHGVTRAVNYELIRRNVTEENLLDDWHRQVEATGELSLLCYREEIEAALRTEGFSGISLLGLQDFPGQGTALVGMLSSHLRPKPYTFAHQSVSVRSSEMSCRWRFCRVIPGKPVKRCPFPCASPTTAAKP